uniref:Uncharacterized protein n=1 Tax=Physcomitrium patens TaxID=3218 RepID=A0A2K1IIA3_PHYPA|nr:hypothetical protein PHYPA_027695 [Physcomitrium patens]
MVQRLKRPSHPCDALVAAESFANVVEQFAYVTNPLRILCGGFVREIEVAYSIALGSSVAAVTLWDRPYNL